MNGARFLAIAYGSIAVTVLAMALFTLLRSTRSATAKKRQPIRTTETTLPREEILRRLHAVAREAGHTVTVAEDPDRVILASKGMPFGVHGPGFLFPVYLTDRQGGTLVEVGVRRRFPAARHLLTDPLDACFAAIERALAE